MTIGTVRIDSPTECSGCGATVEQGTQALVVATGRPTGYATYAVVHDDATCLSVVA